jgi:hypothetical protein
VLKAQAMALELLEGHGLSTPHVEVWVAPTAHVPGHSAWGLSTLGRVDLGRGMHALVHEYLHQLDAAQARVAAFDPGRQGGSTGHGNWVELGYWELSIRYARLIRTSLSPDPEDGWGPGFEVVP